MPQFDCVTTSHVDSGFEDWRMKHYKHLYFCAACARNFETVQEEKKCKFCFSDVRELERKDSANRSKKFSYHCYKCGKRFFPDTIVHSCEKCGSQVFQSHPHSAARMRDRLMLRLNSAKNRASGFRLRKPSIRFRNTGLKKPSKVRQNQQMNTARTTSIFRKSAKGEERPSD